jgi:hypothetical protein
VTTSRTRRGSVEVRRAARLSRLNLAVECCFCINVTWSPVYDSGN